MTACEVMYLEKFRRLVQFWMRVLDFNIWNEKSFTLSKKTIFTGLYFLSVLFVTGSFIAQNFYSVKYESLAEPVVTFVVFIRQIVYLTTFIANNQKWTKALKKIENERKNKAHNQSSSDLIRSYSKQEYYSLIFFYVSGSTMLLIVVSSNLFFEVNELRLPVNFNLTFLSFTGFSITWAANYIFQVIMIVNASCFLYIYLPLTMILLNHSCWQLDETQLRLKTLNNILQKDPDGFLVKQEVKEAIKHVVEMGSDALEWQSDVQSLIGFNFLTEFSLLSSIIAMCLYYMTAFLFDSAFIVCVLVITLVQLYFYCFMGNRVIVRIENISVAAYETDWYSIELQHRKDIMTIIQVTQNMQGFSGIFKPLSMATFMKILELSYSILTLLTSIQK